MKIWATYNIKGGVGKTATAVNLGYLAARAGYRTLIWDLDPQGAASFYFRIQPKVKGGAKALLSRGLDPFVRGTDYRNLHLLPADFSYRKLDLRLEDAKKPAQVFAELLMPLEEVYDLLILDCPPSISRASESVFVAANALLVPTIPTTLSLRTLEQLRKHLRKEKKRRRPELVPFFCMVDRRKFLHRQITKNPPDKAGFLASTVPYSTWAEQMGLRRQPIHEFARTSPPAKAYEELWDEIVGRVGLER